MDDIEFRVRALVGKIRNVIYYRGIDDRTRANYSYILRECRRELNEVISELVINENLELFRKLYNAIPPKANAEDVDETITRLKFIIENEQ